MPDILCFSTTDWDETWGSRQQVMLRFVERGCRVLFVERQVGPEHLLRDPALRQRKRIAWKRSRLVKIQSNLWRWQPPMMWPGRYYSHTLNRFGQGWLAGCVRPVLERLGFEKPILWLYPPHSSPLLWKFSERISIYHCIERFSGDQRGRKYQVMEAQERDLLHKAGLVFVHSAGLERLYAPLTRRPPVLTPSCADVGHYQSTSQIHPLIEAIPHPRLVVMGTLDARIDIELLETIATLRSDWHIVLIGPIHHERSTFSSLLEFPNVHSLGKQPFQELPALLNGADVCLIPYRLTGMTKYINPLKAYEYLAAGKPVVSVDLPELRPFSEWISFPSPLEMKEGYLPKAQVQTGFIQTIQDALQNDSPDLHENRHRIAWQYDWNHTVEKMVSVLQESGVIDF